jgi:hypothetical protein
MRLSRVLVLTTVLFVAFAAPAAATTEVPIKGTVVGPGGPQTDGGGVPQAPGCAAGAIWRFDSSGTGTMAHLGRVGYELSHCTYVDPATGLFLAKDGEITFTAADGDTLVVAEEGVFEGIADATGLIGFEGGGTWTAIGGTGRFAHATGSGSWSVVGDIPGGDELFGLPDGWMKIDLTGRIAYTASDRSER